MSPDQDKYLPVLLIEDYTRYSAVAGKHRWGGGFPILPDGETLYFFFTPDARSLDNSF
jgi:hypothetical protein